MTRMKKRSDGDQGRQAMGLERLEGRQMMSASPHAALGRSESPGHGDSGGQAVSSIAFSLTPAAVQSGLDKLAATDGLADPTATTSVQLGDSGGVETYSVTLKKTGTVSRLTVDQTGAAVTAPTQTTTTFGTLVSAPAAEVKAIATALGLTAPTSSTAVRVTTTSAGAVTYSVVLSGSTTTTTNGKTSHTGSVTVTVDAAGNPAGHQTLPASVFSAAIRTGLNAAAPTGATALTATSTQDVQVGSRDGVTTYSTTFTVSGTRTTVTVNAAGKAVAADTRTSGTLAAAPKAARTELQTLATALGGSIASTAATTVYTEANGTTLYATTVSVADSSTSTSTTTHSTRHTLTLVVDAAGNPTTLPDGMGLAGACGH